MTAPLRLLEEFDDYGHLNDCPARFPSDVCDCSEALLAVARATRLALEQQPPRLVVGWSTSDLPPDSVLEDARRALAAREDVGDPGDPLILIRQLRACLGAMLSPAPFGKEAVTGLHVYGRVLDQLQAYLLEWGEFALEHPDRVPRAT
jgi:hypothetical protein